jgi:hypothetical protein
MRDWLQRLSLPQLEITGIFAPSAIQPSTVRIIGSPIDFARSRSKSPTILLPLWRRDIY